MNDINDIIQVVKCIADKELIVISKNGKATAGKNGPYNCEDTNIRNSAHWIKIYKFLLKLTEKRKYYNVIKLLGDYLAEEQNYGTSGAITCMHGNKMDHLNGTIGQGWAIEGLICAYECIKDEKFLDKAKQIYLTPEYNYDLHAWERVELDGKNIGIDKVFNHQLWFAANSAFIFRFIEDADLRAPLDDFVQNIDKLFSIYKDGLLKHYIVGFEDDNKTKIKILLKKITAPLKFFDQRFDNKSFERGYHLFDLYGFALLYENYSDALVFNSDKFRKAVSYGMDIDRINKDINAESTLKYKYSKINSYAYPYNSPAFEYPFIDYTFNHSHNSSK